MLDLFQGTFGQSACSLVIFCFLSFFFSFYIRSKPTGGRFLYCSHGNCPRKAMSVRKERGERRFIYLYRGSSLDECKWFYICVIEDLMTLTERSYNKPEYTESQGGGRSVSFPSRPVHRWVEPRGGWVMRAEETEYSPGTDDLSHLPISTASFQTPAPAPQLDSLQKGVSSACTASKWQWGALQYEYN